MNKVCHIVGGGDFFGIRSVGEGDFIIAADKGFRYLQNLGITPDLVIGDFDSLGHTPSGRNIIVLPCEKNDTDMGAAVAEGVERGYKNFILYGATGGRPDHTLANIQLISLLSSRGMNAIIDARETSFTSITNGGIIFGDGAKGTVSVFSHSDISCGVTVSGLKYGLKNGTLKNTYALGVSNEFIGAKSEIQWLGERLRLFIRAAPSPCFQILSRAKNIFEPHNILRRDAPREHQQENIYRRVDSYNSSQCGLSAALRGGEQQPRKKRGRHADGRLYYRVRYIYFESAYF